MINTIETAQIKYKKMKLYDSAPKSIRRAENGRNNTTENLDSRERT